jgi:hypothetical protein
LSRYNKPFTQKNNDGSEFQYYDFKNKEKIDNDWAPIGDQKHIIEGAFIYNSAKKRET